MSRAMVVAPHPDDAELAMGGTIAKMIESGWDVTVVDLTDGEPTPLGSKEVREKEAARASQILGIVERICLQMPNRYLEANLENRRHLAEVIRLSKPDYIFGPAIPDYHPDHVAAAKLVDGARFEAKFHKTDMKGVPHWTDWQFAYYGTHRRQHELPSFIVDVTDQWDKKIQAIQAYGSQIASTSSSESAFLLERVKVTNRYFGQCIGSRYGEPFVSREPIGVKRLQQQTDFINV